MTLACTQPKPSATAERMRANVFSHDLPPRRTADGGNCQTLRTDSSRMVCSPRPKGARLARAMIWRTCVSGTGKDRVPTPAISTRGNGVSKPASTKKSPGRRTPERSFSSFFKPRLYGTWMLSSDTPADYGVAVPRTSRGYFFVRRNDNARSSSRLKPTVNKAAGMPIRIGLDTRIW